MQKGSNLLDGKNPGLDSYIKYHEVEIGDKLYQGYTVEIPIKYD